MHIPKYYWIHRQIQVDLPNSIEEPKFLDCIQCSNCMEEFAVSRGYTLYYKFCPACGVKMTDYK